MKKRGGLFWALSFYLLAMFFCWAKIVQAAPVVLINEIAWMGTASSTNAEWLELYNNTAVDITIDNWTLKARDGQPNIILQGVIKANDYFLLERTSDETLPNVLANQIYSGALGNTGEFLELKDSGGEIIDSLDATVSWPGGDNITKATLERLADLTWATSTNAGGTPKALNSVISILIISPPAEEIIITAPEPGTSVLDSLPANITPINLPKIISIYPGEIVINEIMSDPLDGEVEWLELYLAVDKTIDLTGATIEDGSQAKTSLTGVLSPANRFLVMESPKGNLNNSGDLILLRDGNKSVVDQVVYGDWAMGQFNAPVARDGASLARRFDGVNTFNAQADWVVTQRPSKELPNQIVGNEGEIMSLLVNTKNIYINEILPDPVGDDLLGEYIELYNQGSEIISLDGWRIQTQSGQTYKFGSSTALGGHEIKAVYRSTTHLSLINGSGLIKLIPPGSETPTQSVNYKNGKVGQSYMRVESGSWEWTEKPTPGTINIQSQKNQPPQISFYVKTPIEIGEAVVFDSSDTVDPEGDILHFSWQLGDGASSSLANPEHVYFKKGSFQVVLTVSDGQNSLSLSELIKVIPKDVSEISAGQPKNSSSTKYKLFVNEIMPNPVGSDESEWIEIYNYGTVEINLFGWTIDDGPDGSKPYHINEELIIEPQEYLLLERAETDLALNNNADVVRLFDVENNLIDAVAYQKANEGLSWSRASDGGYGWSLVATPGSQNVIKVEALKTSVKKSSVKAVKLVTNLTGSDSEIGDEAVFQCVATCLPGQLAAQYFYCENDRGWQIYNYKKDFPIIGIGDLLEVRGIVSQTNGNWRLKIRDQSGIKKVGEKILEVVSISLEDIGPANYGKLIKIQGEVTKKSGTSFYLDDNTSEATIQLKASAGLSTTNITIGEIYDLMGIAQASQSGLKILPRNKEDIKRQRPEMSLGELATGTETWLTKPNRAKGYVVVAGSSTVLLFGLWAMRRMGMKF